MQELRKVFKIRFRKNLNKEGTLSIKEEVQCFLEGIVIVMVFAYFFYRSYVACVFLSPLLLFYRKHKKKQILKIKIESMEQQFKETILSVQTNLQAGYSMENAFMESYQDVVRIYGENSYMGQELEKIKRGLNNGNTLENILQDLGKRCPNSEIYEFANLYCVGCKTGNQWKEIISKTVSLITQKIELKEEIEILVHGKKTESRIMCIVPFFILFYMDITSKGYFDVLYHNIVGMIIMTICMIVYIAAYLLSEKITEIE